MLFTHGSEMNVYQERVVRPLVTRHFRLAIKLVSIKALSLPILSKQI